MSARSEWTWDWRIGAVEAMVLNWRGVAFEGRIPGIEPRYSHCTIKEKIVGSSEWKKSSSSNVELE